MKINRGPLQHPLKVVLVYAAVSATWMLLSDKLIEIITRSPSQLALASTLKGWVFILVTSLLLYWLITRKLPADTAQAERMTQDTRSILLPSLLIALFVIPLTAILVYSTIQEKKSSEIKRLQAIADLKAEFVHNWLRERHQDLHYIQHSLDIPATAIESWLLRYDENAFMQINAQLNAIEHIGQFEGVDLLDGSGVSLWKSSSIRSHGKNPVTSAILQLAESGDVEHFGPYRDNHGEAHLDFIIPLKNKQQVTEFTLVLHMDPSEHLLSAVSDWPVPTKSGEVVLFRRDGAEIAFLNNLKHAPDAAIRLRWPLDDKTLLAAQLARGDYAMAHVVEGKDYRNESVFGVGRSIPDSDLFLLAKMDWSEVYDDALQSAMWMGLSGFLALIMGISGFYLLRQRQQILLAEATSQAQTERIQALNLLSCIADSSTDAIYAKDLQGRYLFFNKQAELFTGRSKNEVLGKDDHFLFPSDQAEMVMNNDRMLVDLDKVVTLQEQMDTVSGPVIFLATKGPLQDDNGEIIGVFGVSRDITAMHRMEQDLREKEARYRELVDNMSDGVAVYEAVDNGEDFVFTEYNKAGERIGKNNRNEVIGSRVTEIFPNIEKLGLLSVLKRVWLTGEAEYFPVNSYRDERLRIWVDNYVFRLPGGEVVAIYNDVSDRKLAELKISRLNNELEERVIARTRELEAANSELESFVYSVSHDLRAPLRAVTGFAQILVNRHLDSLNDEGQHYLENVLQAGIHMGELIDDLLQYSRTGRGALQMRPIEIAPVIKGLEVTFQERLKKAGVRLIVEEPLAIPMGDATLIRQQFTNLIDNALTYNHESTPVIRIASKRKDDHVFITFTDNGIGIAPEYHEKIFQVFQRLHSQDEFPGTGVGLAIVAKAARMMGGEVKVESSLGAGSRFTIVLPAADIV